jgi:hypothetical protein
MRHVVFVEDVDPAVPPEQSVKFLPKNAKQTTRKILRICSHKFAA